MPPDPLLQGALLVGTAALFCAVACALHVVVWRLSRSTPSGLTLIVLLTGAILVQCALAGLLAASSVTVLVVGALALQLAACYAISYPAMQAHSPSLEIARHLAAAGQTGIGRADLYARLDEAQLVRERIEDLLRDGLAAKQGTRLVCTGRGALLAHLFGAWKSLLREPKGG